MSSISSEKRDTKEIFENMPVGKALAAMAVPTVISQLIVLIYNLADTFFIGRTNNPAMVAGVSLILPVFNISISLAGLAGTGGSSLISRLLGTGNESEAKKTSVFCLYMAAAVSAFFSVVVFIFMRPILTALGAGDATYDFARQYAFCVIVLGGIPTVLSNTMSMLLRSTGCSREAGFGISMGGLVNMALDPLLMFVILPSGHEIIGAGTATFLSNVLSCLYFFTVIYKKRGSNPVTFSPKARLLRTSSLISVFGVGIPSALATFLFDIDYVVIDKLMSAYGETALAAVGIVLKAERLPLNIGIGICQGMMPLAAYSYASKNYDRMKSIIKTSRLWGLLTALCSVLMYEVCASFILRIFIDDAATSAYGTGFLRIRCLATPLMFLSFHMVYLFNAFGKGGVALFLGVARWMAFNIPMLFILNKIIGMYGIVWSQFAADILTVSLSFFVFFLFERKELVRK